MHKITLLPGDGIGPEVAEAAKIVIEATGVKVSWDIQQVGQKALDAFGDTLPVQVIESIKKNRVALKAPVTTPVGSGFRSVNVALRKELDLYANFRPCRTFPGIESRYENIDLIIVRENTEDLYAGIERMIDEDTGESVKIITRKGSERIVRFACEYALAHGRKKVTAVHKANIMKCTDGLFLEVARSVAKDYPSLVFDDKLVDALCMDLVMIPESYDVLVLPNLYGDIVSDLCSGLVGGLGVSPGANIGIKCAIFEPVHGSAPEIAGKNIANPAALILSGALMLRHIGETAAGDRLENAVIYVIKEGKVKTADLGGNAGTLEFADAVAAKL
jgi:isocitrate dehydrogenase (NAD+)